MHGRRKVFRPLDRKRALHVVLKTSQAKGRLSLLARKLEVKRLIDAKAEQFRVKIHGFQNMGNHIHTMISFKSRKEIQNFLSTMTGHLGQLITQATKAKPFGKRFWDHLAFTRIITSRRDYRQTENYLRKNHLERDFGAGARAILEASEDLARRARRRKMTIEEYAVQWIENGDPHVRVITV